MKSNESLINVLEQIRDIKVKNDRVELLEAFREIKAIVRKALSLHTEQGEVNEGVEKLRNVLYSFRDLYCQNIDLSTVDEFIDGQSSQPKEDAGIEEDQNELWDKVIEIVLSDSSWHNKELPEKLKEKYHITLKQ